jgi:hypothetical protein
MALTFDYSRICTQTAGRVWPFQDFGYGMSSGAFKMFRGKNPPAR